MADGGATASAGARAREELGFSRWWQFGAAVAVMALASPYKYVRSSVEGPLAGRLDVPLAALGAFFQGTQHSLVPSLVGDHFGSAHSSTNYTVVYPMEIGSGLFGGTVVIWLAAGGAALLDAPETEA